MKKKSLDETLKEMEIRIRERIEKMSIDELHTLINSRAWINFDKFVKASIPENTKIGGPDNKQMVGQLEKKVSKKIGGSNVKKKIG